MRRNDVFRNRAAETALVTNPVAPTIQIKSLRLLSAEAYKNDAGAGHQSVGTPFVVVHNWLDELKRGVPAR